MNEDYVYIYIYICLYENQEHMDAYCCWIFLRIFNDRMQLCYSDNYEHTK